MTTRIRLPIVLWLAALAGCNVLARREPAGEKLAACRELSQQGIRALENGRNEEAERLLHSAVETCPGDIEARRSYAEALWRRGQLDQAASQMIEATKQTANDDSLLVRCGEMCLATGRLAQATDAATRAIDINPSSAPAWRLRGELGRQSGQYREALADLHRSLSHDGTNRDTLLAIAETYRTLGEPRRAFATLQALADTYPPGEQPQHVLYLEGLSLLAMDRTTDAAEVFERAQAAGAPSADVCCALAHARMRMGDVPRAAAAAHEALAIDGQHAQARQLVEQLDAARGMLAGRPR